MKRLVLISIISMIGIQCSYIERQRLQIPQALATKNTQISIHFPLVAPQPEHSIVGKPKSYVITITKPQSHQETVFQVLWTFDDQLDVLPAFLKNLSTGESQKVHGVVVHKINVQTASNTTYTISFAVSKTGTEIRHSQSMTEEDIFNQIIPTKIPILKNGHPVGHIKIREWGVPYMRADVIWDKRVWDVTFQSILNKDRFLISTPHGPLAFFKLKPANKIISSTNTGTAFFNPQTPDHDITMAVLSYIYSYALFQANSME